MVENGSTDGSREYFASNIEGRYPGIQVVYVPENQGYGYGIQQGIKAASGEYIGWVHADLQMPPEELIPFFDDALANNEGDSLFMKGRRTNRSLFDKFFTNGQSVFNTVLFKTRLYDVGAIPVLFDRKLLNTFTIEDMPNDFSIELYIYLQAKKSGYVEKRKKVKLVGREKGKSSWNNGLKSKIRQSKRIFGDSIKIWKGEKVL